MIFADSWCFNILPISLNKLLGTGFIGYHMAYNRGIVIVIVIGDVELADITVDLQ